MSRADVKRIDVSKDCIIAVMGPTGVGKSTFINCATRQDGSSIGHNLKSFTSEIRAVRTFHPRTKRPVVFVDTPGFDDTYRSETEILALIAEWLVKVYKQEIRVAGILYLHRITDNRMTGSVLKNFHVFEDIYGRAAHKKVTLVTTMWDNIKEERGLQREEELKKEYWQEAIAAGAKMVRFQGTFESAWSIIRRFFDETECASTEESTTAYQPVQIQREVAVDHLTLKETEAAQTLSKELAKMLKEQEEANRRLQDLVQDSGNQIMIEQLNARKEELDKQIVETKRQIDELKLRVMQRLARFGRAIFHATRRSRS